MKIVFDSSLPAWNSPIATVARVILTTALVLSPVSILVAGDYESDPDQLSTMLTARSVKPIQPVRRIDLV